MLILASSLPGSLGMYGLAVGIFKVNEVLPRAVYGLLSGLNAATVGIIALAAVQLAQKAITDRLTRILVILGACAGMLYNALWYFPVLMAIAGISTIILDFRILHKPIIKISNLLRGIHGVDEPIEMNALERELARPPTENAPSHSTPATAQGERSELPVSVDQTTEEGRLEPRVIPEERKIKMSWQFGAVIIAGFFVTFIIIMVLRGTLRHPPLLFNFFANMYLAGTIIFGGGPVVIPLLREYVVVEGWVSPRDFLIGLAIIQAFPGPNFAFAVYLGSLTALSAGYSGALGAFLGFVGIFMPGLILVHGTLGLWQTLRSHRWVKSLLRGINAGAVGLIYTAVYRLWQIGYVDVGFTAGTSLGNDPWWVVITVVSYCGGYWFHLNAPSAIILGAVMGLIRYGVISH